MDIERLNIVHNGKIQAPGNPRNGELRTSKSETGDNPIIEFVGLRAKMYSYMTASDMKEHMKAKEVPKGVLEKCMQNNFYAGTRLLDSGIQTTINMQSICNYQHQLYTVQMLKRDLLCNDVKCWICPDNIITLPYGYNPLSRLKRYNNVKRKLSLRNGGGQDALAEMKIKWQHFFDN